MNLLWIFSDFEDSCLVLSSINQLYSRRSVNIITNIRQHWVWPALAESILNTKYELTGDGNHVCEGNI